MKIFQNSSEQKSFVVFRYEGNDEKEINLYLITDEVAPLQTLASHIFISESLGFGKGFYFVENPQDLDNLDVYNKCLIECQVKIGKSIILTIQNAHNAEELMSLKKCQSVKGYLNETQKFYIIYNSSQIIKTLKIIEKEFQIVFSTTYPKCKNHLCLYKDKHHSEGCHRKCNQKNCLYFFKYHPSPCKLVCINSNCEKFESYHESKCFEKCQNKYCKCFKSYHEGPCTNLAMNEVDNSEEIQLNRKHMHTTRVKTPRPTTNRNSKSPTNTERYIGTRKSSQERILDSKGIKNKPKLTKEEALISSSRSYKPEIMIPSGIKTPPPLLSYHNPKPSKPINNQNLEGENKNIENSKLIHQKDLELNHEPPVLIKAPPSNLKSSSPINQKFQVNQIQRLVVPEVEFQVKPIQKLVVSDVIYQVSKFQEPPKEISSQCIPKPIIAQVPQKNVSELKHEKNKVAPRLVKEEKYVDLYANKLQESEHGKLNETKYLESEDLFYESYEIPIITIPQNSRVKNPTISNQQQVSDSSDTGCCDSIKKIFVCFSISLLIGFLTWYFIIK